MTYTRTVMFLHMRFESNSDIVFSKTELSEQLMMLASHKESLNKRSTEYLIRASPMEEQTDHRHPSMVLSETISVRNPLLIFKTSMPLGNKWYVI